MIELFKDYFLHLDKYLPAFVNAHGAWVYGLLFVVIFAMEKAGPRSASFSLTPAVAWLPLVFLQVALFSFGTGLWLAALTAKFRDFTVLVGFIVQLYMYASPVIYPLSRVPSRWYLLAALNPMTFPLEALRHMLLNAGNPTAFLCVLSSAMTLLTLAGGVLVFQRVEKNFVDVI